MKRPRKKYRHDPGKKWENPLCRQAEAAGMRRWQEKHFAMMDEYADGTEQAAMLVTLADVIAPAIKSMEGWDDPDNIGDVMCDAMDVLGQLAQDGFKWRASAMPLLKEATTIALQVTNGMPVVEIARACAWARQIDLKTRRPAGSLLVDGDD